MAVSNETSLISSEVECMGIGNCEIWRSRGPYTHRVRNNIILNVDLQTVVCHGFEDLIFGIVTYGILWKVLSQENTCAILEPFFTMVHKLWRRLKFLSTDEEKDNIQIWRIVVPHKQQIWTWNRSKVKVKAWCQMKGLSQGTCMPNINALSLILQKIWARFKFLWQTDRKTDRRMNKEWVLMFAAFNKAWATTTTTIGNHWYLGFDNYMVYLIGVKLCRHNYPALIPTE